MIEHNSVARTVIVATGESTHHEYQSPGCRTIPSNNRMQVAAQSKKM